jgi:hypothetical protein
MFYQLLKMISSSALIFKYEAKEAQMERPAKVLDGRTERFLTSLI